MSHSILPPSSAHIWGKAGGCTGYVRMMAVVPESAPTDASLEGDAVHAYAAACLTGEAATHPVDPEALEAAEMFVDDVLRRVQTGGAFYVEQKIPIPRVAPDCFGTPDAFYYDPGARRVYIWDFKYGYSIVEVFENWQMLTYAAGILGLLGINGILDQSTTVEFRLIQPRAPHADGPVRDWKVRASDLRAYFNILRNNAEANLAEVNAEFGMVPTLHTGDHCKNCDARHRCPAALAAGFSLFEASATPVPLDVTPAALGVLLSTVRRAKKQIKYLESGIEAQVEGLVRAGVDVPGYRLEQGKGKEKWTASPEVIAKLGSLCGVEIGKTAVLTPNQSRKKGLDPDVVAEMSRREGGSIKLVFDDGSKARRVFGR